MRFILLILALFYLAAIGVSAQTLDEKVLNIFFHNLIDSLTRNGNGFDPIFNPTNSYVQMALRGIPINPNQFNNLISAQNLDGDARQSEYFSRLVNVNGALSNIEQSYSDVINSASALPDDDPSRKAAHDAAFNFLYVNQSHTDKFTGVTTYQTVKSPIYVLYQQKQAAYTSALSTYRLAQATFDLSKVTDQRQWFAQEPVLNNNVQTAYNDFQSIASDVEDALNALASLGSSLSSTIIAENKQLLKDTQLASLLGSSGGHFHMSFAEPWDFATNDDYYMSFSITSDEDHVSGSSSYSSWKAGGGFSGFFGFGFGASAGGETNRVNRHSDATHIKITGNLTLVRIDRPWLWDSLFKVNGWSMPGLPAGSVSRGISSIIANEAFPSYCSHLILVKDLKIRGDWSQQDLSFYSQHNHVDTRVTFGPFTLAGGSYDSQSSQETVTGQTVQDAFVVPGLQIIGWVNTIIPFSPQLSGVRR